MSAKLIVCREQKHFFCFVIRQNTRGIKQKRNYNVVFLPSFVPSFLPSFLSSSRPSFLSFSFLFFFLPSSFPSFLSSWIKLVALRLYDMIQVVRIFSVQLSTLVRFFHQVKITLARLLVTHVQKCRTLPPFLYFFFPSFLLYFPSPILYSVVARIFNVLGTQNSSNLYCKVSSSKLQSSADKLVDSFLEIIVLIFC